MRGSVRTQTITQKTQTAFGSIFVHVEYTRRGVTGISFSQPGKIHNSTTVGRALDQIGETCNEIIEGIGA